MAQQNRTALKLYFETGDTPTEAQFVDLIDSFPTFSDDGTPLVNLVEDTTPQLGGSLDVNGNSIVSVSNGNITLTPDGTGNVILGNFIIDADATIGAGQDNFVLRYDHSTTSWGPEALPAAGDAWGDAVDADIVPSGDGLWDLGSAVNRFANIHVDSIDLNGTTLDGTTLAAPADDSILFYDKSALTTAYLDLGTGLAFSDTTLTLTSASDTAAGIIELATVAETDTGTATDRAITPDALAGSDFGKEVVTVCLFDDSEDVTVATGNDAGDQLFRVPSKINGWNLVEVAAYHQTAGTGTGTQDTLIMVHNITDAADMMSTGASIREDELDTSDTNGSAGTINTAADDVATGDKIGFAVDTVTGTTAPKGLWVELTFQAP